MKTPQTIVIIGAEETGRAIAAGLAKGHDRIIICDADQQKAESVAEQIRVTDPRSNMETVACSYEATWEADIIILTLSSCPARQEIAGKVKPVASQKIVVTVDDAVKEFQNLLPHSKIVRAFRGIDPDDFLKSAEEKKKIKCDVCGTDKEAVDAVADLVKAIGFRPVLHISEAPVDQSAKTFSN